MTTTFVEPAADFLNRKVEKKDGKKGYPQRDPAEVQAIADRLCDRIDEGTAWLLPMPLVVKLTRIKNDPHIDQAGNSLDRATAQIEEWRRQVSEYLRAADPRLATAEVKAFFVPALRTYGHTPKGTQEKEIIQLPLREEWEYMGGVEVVDTDAYFLLMKDPDWSRHTWAAFPRKKKEETAEPPRKPKFGNAEAVHRAAALSPVPKFLREQRSPLGNKSLDRREADRRRTVNRQKRHAAQSRKGPG